MWKLIIIQKRKSIDSEYTFEEKVEFVGNNLDEMCEIIIFLAKREGGKETIYRIEKVEEGENDGI
jgi:hypothetical protein